MLSAVWGQRAGGGEGGPGVGIGVLVGIVGGAGPEGAGIGGRKESSWRDVDEWMRAEKGVLEQAGQNQKIDQDLERRICDGGREILRAGGSIEWIFFI